MLASRTAPLTCVEASCSATCACALSSPWRCACTCTLARPPSSRSRRPRSSDRRPRARASSSFRRDSAGASTRSRRARSSTSRCSWLAAWIATFSSRGASETSLAARTGRWGDALCCYGGLTPTSCLCPVVCLAAPAARIYSGPKLSRRRSSLARDLVHPCPPLCAGRPRARARVAGRHHGRG